ncbi:MAG: 1-(5-phosphoribosyl)-5-[(5-phosphoribosylamino)methylideneamino] imidazole-4-carboxamide isomerase [Chloroflexi bacterium]|nr:1-(5-phosphoribosyl)-5-[(5-phosphoribosylamino)methylideneamino] imidazole-4-carboxamide isomerase [Chloroflexota bacterium]
MTSRTEDPDVVTWRPEASPAPGSVFQLLPAIDLIGGRVVRLERGDFSRETAFSDDPRAVARAFIDAGARWIHVVDLDAARSGIPIHEAAIRAIVAEAGPSVRIEVAGGRRTADGVAAALKVGADRVVLGTAALVDPAFASRLVTRYGPERVVVSLDVRDGRAVGNAWKDGTDDPPVGLALDRLLDAGVRWFEVTAIHRDGTLAGPDLELLEFVRHDPRAVVIASGGISTPADIRAVRSMGCAGAIVGRALYDGTMSLEAALRAAADVG